MSDSSSAPRGSSRASRRPSSARRPSSGRRPKQPRLAVPDQPSPHPPSPAPSLPAKPPPVSPSLPIKTQGAPATPKAAPTPSGAYRPPSKRVNSNSTNVPSLVVNGSTPTTPAPSSSLPRSPRGRKRAHNNPPKQHPTLDDSLLRPAKSRDIKPAIYSAPVRDLPPHLDIRHDIDALVERVRAIAMDNRPLTWAGEDDDSLPDLEDWGIKTPNLHSDTDQEPTFLVPDPASISPGSDHNPSESHTDPLSSTVPTKQVADLLPSSAKAESDKGNSLVSSLPPASQSPRAPLHPSLPQKPAAAELPQPTKSTGATPMRNDYPKAQVNSDVPKPPRSPAAASASPMRNTYHKSPTTDRGNGKQNPSSARNSTSDRRTPSSSK